MKLKTLIEDTPRIGEMAHSKTKFFVQWSVGRSGERIPVSPFWMGPNSMGKVLDIRFEKGRPDIDTEDLYTVTMQFLYGGLNGKGCVGMANGPSLDSLIKRYK